jgi:hypothetical protein
MCRCENYEPNNRISIKLPLRRTLVLMNIIRQTQDDKRKNFHVSLFTIGDSSSERTSE